MHFYAKDGGQKYPISPGDIWQAGPHVIACNDLYHGKSLDTALQISGAPYAVYVDPPWGAGVEKSYRTKAGLPIESFVNYSDLITKIYTRIRTVPGPIAVECGRLQVDLFRACAHFVGMEETATVPIVYGSGSRPAVLLGYHGADLRDCAGMDDRNTPLIFLSGLLPSRNTIVFDPCTGRGATAIAADEANLTFVGGELTPTRMSVTLRKLADRGHVPILVNQQIAPRTVSTE